MKLTAEMLRDIADSLNADTRGPSRGEFICCAALHLFDIDTEAEVRALLIDGGIETLSGCLFNSEIGVLHPVLYTHSAMPVRFMFLEFLALMLEDE